MSETIGIVGIGVMGKNIALNFSDNDINVVVNPIKAKKNIGYLPEHNPLYLEMYVKESPLDSTGVI